MKSLFTLNQKKSAIGKAYLLSNSNLVYTGKNGKMSGYDDTTGQELPQISKSLMPRHVGAQNSGMP